MALLFEELPPGFRYLPEFVMREEELALVREIQAMEFSEVRMRGRTARRRVQQFGWRYNFDTLKLSEGPELPAFLRPLRARAAAMIAVRDEDLAETLVTEYRQGATIGWHRDAPMFGIVVGISLLSACVFKLRRATEARTQRPISIEMAPRSAYVLNGEVRRDWQHSIPAVKALRYSITFRTVRRKDHRRGRLRIVVTRR
jgi:alkylated DNA repair protein (DNA oxidative demethylase)